MQNEPRRSSFIFHFSFFISSIFERFMTRHPQSPDPRADTARLQSLIPNSQSLIPNPQSLIPNP